MNIGRELLNAAWSMGVKEKTIFTTPELQYSILSMRLPKNWPLRG
jgi:hypothetical protein